MTIPLRFASLYDVREVNTGTCIQKGNLFYSVGLHRNHVLAIASTGEIGKGVEKMQVNGPEG